jgi:chromosomal replication initiation ATPase DnaA
MGENAELEQLLKNIQSGLKKYSIKELKDGIVSYFNKNDDKTLEINTILNVVSEHFDTTIATLKQKNVHGSIHDAKQICYCILNFQLGLSTRYIAERIFGYSVHTNVHRGIMRYKNANIELKPDREFVEKYELLKNKCIDKFKKK